MEKTKVEHKTFKFKTIPKEEDIILHLPNISSSSDDETNEFNDNYDNGTNGDNNKSNTFSLEQPEPMNPVQANPNQVNPAQANLAQVSLAQANLTQANLTQANLAQADLTQANPTLNPNPIQDNPNDMHPILSISDLSFDTEKKNTYVSTNKLLKELNKKDEIIEKLNNIIHEFNNNLPQVSPIKKDLTSLPKDINLVNIKDNQTIICEKTDIVCWWDTHNFDTIPWFLPDRYCNNTFYVFGCFCSPNCALAYNLNMNDSRIHIRTSLLKKLDSYIYDKSELSENITASFKPEILKKFGGPMDIVEYRSNTSLLKKEIKINIPPIIHIKTIVEELNKEKS